MIETGRLLRYRIDVVSVLTVAFGLGLQLWAVLAAWPAWALLVVLPALRQVILVEHNHAHLRVFVRRWANELLSWMVFLATGVPVEFYEIHHVANHHRHNQRFDAAAQDWSSLFGFAGARHPDRPVSRAYYVLSFPLLTICHSLIAIARAPGSPIFWRYLRAAAFVTAASAWLISVDAFRFALFFLMPWVIVQFALGYNNYWHHQGCRLTGPHDSSNDYLDVAGRWLGFNIGYHAAHHLQPALHWSLLPRCHERLRAEQRPGVAERPAAMPAIERGPAPRTA
jgi:fatty acid desaturase